MDARELRTKSDDDLRKELLALNREAFNLRMQKGIGQLNRPTELGKLRRDIARIKTILGERERT